MILLALTSLGLAIVGALAGLGLVLSHEPTVAVRYAVCRDLWILADDPLPQVRARQRRGCLPASHCGRSPGCPEGLRRVTRPHTVRSHSQPFSNNPLRYIVLLCMMT